MVTDKKPEEREAYVFIGGKKWLPLNSFFSLKCAYCMDFELNGGSKTTPAVTIYAGIAFCNEHYRIFRSLND